MLVVWAFEVLVPWALVLLVITQVVLPLWKGTPLFPIFRRRHVHSEVKQAAEEVEQLEEQLRAARLRHEAEALRAAIKREGGA